jgi:hypothetical protein
MSNYKDLKHKNLVDKGLIGTTVATGTTAQRGSGTGQFRFNTTTGKFEGRNASSFVTIEATPSVSSIDVTEVDSGGGGNQTFVITGGNFVSGDVVKFVGDDASEFNATTTTVDSITQITAVVPKVNFLNAQEPYDVTVTSAGGLIGTLTNQINVDNAPTWTTAAGSLGNIALGATGTHFTMVAADADGDTVTYAVQSGTLPSGSSLATATGIISGTITGSLTTYSFTLRATANAKTADRAFTITVIETNYFGDESDGALNTTS